MLRPGYSKDELTPSKIILRFFEVVGIILISLIILICGVITVVCKGPSEAARDILVVSAMETSAMKFVPKIFFSEEEIATIINLNKVIDTEEIIDTELVVIPPVIGAEFDLDLITVEEVTGTTFKGKMMIINDPSRVYVATPEVFSKETNGLKVEEMMKRDDAVAGVNGGGFEDENGVGTGGMPIGLVISEGILKFGTLENKYSVIGFDDQHKLVVGNMTAKQAIERGVRDAVSFGPVLIVNGNPVKISGYGGGLNPRTAIGQRKDGSVLILVIDGRQAHSLGASYKDVIDVMQSYDAINAANLDGGSSSLMFYNNELITKCASLYGSRKLPTAFLVKKAAQK